MPTKVWLMRHAQTARPDIFHGAESDTDLSELGYRQAAAVAPYVRSSNPDVLISSNMLRAKKTAQPIADACDLPLWIEPHLHERKVGTLMGQPAQAEFGIWPDTLRRWLTGESDYAPEGAESFDAIQQRVMPIWNRITTEHANRSIVIVAHGIVCRVILLSILPGLSIRDWLTLGRIHNVSISELIHNGSTWNANYIGEIPDVVKNLA